VEIIWKEDVRVWHPRQAWIWQAGGLGVFDPGINALSILTRILPRPAFLTGAELEFPENCAAPIAARLDLADAAGAKMQAVFDWRQTGPQSWDILIRTEDTEIALRHGGNTLLRNGQTLVDAPDAEYPTLYRHFAALIEQGESDVDLSPLVLVADAFLLGRRRLVAAFHDE
jgi:D-galactose 1-dehydrogenase